MFSEQVKKKVREAYEKNMASYPKKKEETDRLIREQSPDEQVGLQYLYAVMTVNDIVSYGTDVIAGYVQASMNMRQQVAYASRVPEELFLAYVLAYRVNDEHIDGSRGILYDRLLPRIQGKTMAEAALEVNYWCYEQATYAPADDRTLGPLAVMRRARGRCGEESTFTVCAMRSVGIPARQCYAPRWAHCDDNHAWVEVWADGGWHYLGACEPEPVLDKGWFTAAASKAMLVHTKGSSLFEEPDAAYKTPVYARINRTAAYGDTSELKVLVTDHGIPQKDVRVEFQVVNYSELCPIYQTRTDQDGRVSFVTGMGDICIYAEKDGRSLLRKADVRLESEAVLDLKDAWNAEERDGWTEDFELVPPAERVAAVPRKADWKAHEKRLAVCDARREEKEAGFAKEEKTDSFSQFLMCSGDNQKEVEAFLSWDGAEDEEKRELLLTLREKDFADITCETLKDALLCSRPYRESYPREAYLAYLLAPRVHNEMLRPVRRNIAEFFRNRGAAFQNGAQVWDYMCENIRIMPDYGAAVETADSFGTLAYGMCDAASFPVVYAAVCRSLGILARLNPVTQKAEYGVKKGTEVVFVSADAKTETGEDGFPKHGARLTLVGESQTPAMYSLQFSLGVWKGGEYHTLSLPGLEVLGETSLNLEPGDYRLLTSVRQIDGSVSARMVCFSLHGDKRIRLSMGEDRTREKIRHVCLHDVTVRQGEKIGPLAHLWRGVPGLLIVADPGKEPTEHLFREILECRRQYRERKIKIAILLKEPSRNATLERVLEALPDTRVFLWQDEKEISRLHVDMQVGDERLPFAVALDAEGRGLFAFVNYNIRTAQTLLHILEI